MLNKFSRLLNKINEHKVLTHAAALAFYTMLSLGPLLMIFFLTLALMKLHVQVQILDQVALLVGENAAHVMESMLQSFKAVPSLSSSAGIFAVVILLIAASAAFSQLKASLDVIISAEIRHKSTPHKSVQHTGKFSYLLDIKDYILHRLFSIAMVFVFLYISIISLLFTYIISSILRFDESTVTYLIINGALSFFLFLLIFFLIFLYTPLRRPTKVPAFKGALLTSILFVFGKELLANLAASTLMLEAYGAGAALIALMAWFYYACVVFFLGAEIVSFCEGQRIERSTL